MKDKSIDISFLYTWLIKSQDTGGNVQNSKFTVVIFTACNRKSIYNLCEYWISKNANIIILATDSRIYSLIRDLKISQIFVNTSLAQRLDFASEKITTPFAFLHSDDDLMPNRFVEKGIRWLNLHPKYSSFSGTVAWLGTNKNVGYWVNNKYNKMNNKGVLNLNQLLENYQFSYIYAIHKAEVMQNVLRIVAKAYKELEGKKTCLALGIEVAIEICFAYMSNLKIARRIYLIKRCDNDQTIENDDMGSIEFLQDEQNAIRISKWVNTISTELSNLESNKSNSTDISQQILSGLGLFQIREDKKRKQLRLLPRDLLKPSTLDMSEIREILVYSIFRSYNIIAAILIKFKVLKRKIYVPFYGIKSFKEINAFFESN